MTFYQKLGILSLVLNKRKFTNKAVENNEKKLLTTKALLGKLTKLHQTKRNVNH